MTLADAQARIPNLHTETYAPDQDAQFLEQVLEDFGRFTPMIALDPIHGLLLDITGCAHLCDGEAGLMQATARRAEKIGLQTVQAIAGTPHCARAVARFGAGGLFPLGQDRAKARTLPVSALEVSAKDEQALRRAGLNQLRDLDDRARGPLAARFGADFPARLARVLGDEDVRITPHRPLPPVTSDRIFFEPIAAPDDIEAVLQDLLEEVSLKLSGLGKGARCFEATFYRVDGFVRSVQVQTGYPTREVSSVMRLFKERFAALTTPLDPGFGFDHVRMTIVVAEALDDVQQDFSAPDSNTEEYAHLVDRLTARLGPDAVLQFSAHASHIPERAQKLYPAYKGARATTESWPTVIEGEPPLRPLHIFNPPQLVETLAEVPDGSPLRFRWRRILHTVVRSEGPERIAGEWWRAPDQRTRDYYRVEDAQGRRFWLFRQGLYSQTPEPRWFIHGLFP